MCVRQKMPCTRCKDDFASVRLMQRRLQHSAQLYSNEETIMANNGSECILQLIYLGPLFVSSDCFIAGRAENVKKKKIGAGLKSRKSQDFSFENPGILADCKSRDSRDPARA